MVKPVDIDDLEGVLAGAPPVPGTGLLIDPTRAFRPRSTILRGMHAWRGAHL